MRVPGHTPLRLRQLQSGYGLFRPRPSKLPQCPQISSPLVGRKPMGTPLSFPRPGVVERLEVPVAARRRTPLFPWAGARAILIITETVPEFLPETDARGYSLTGRAPA